MGYGPRDAKSGTDNTENGSSNVRIPDHQMTAWRLYTREKGGPESWLLLDLVPSVYPLPSIQTRGIKALTQQRQVGVIHVQPYSHGVRHPNKARS